MWVCTFGWSLMRLRVVKTKFWPCSAVNLNFLLQMWPRLHSTGGISVPIRPWKALGRLQNGKMLGIIFVPPTLGWVLWKFAVLPFILICFLCSLSLIFKQRAPADTNILMKKKNTFFLNNLRKSLSIVIWCDFKFLIFFLILFFLLLLFSRVVKEEISDDNAKLPCFNGRVVSWVGWILLFDTGSWFLEISWPSKWKQR